MSSVIILCVVFLLFSLQILRGTHIVSLAVALTTLLYISACLSSQHFPTHAYPSCLLQLFQSLVSTPSPRRGKKADISFKPAPPSPFTTSTPCG